MAPEFRRKLGSAIRRGTFLRDALESKQNLRVVASRAPDSARLPSCRSPRRHWNGDLRQLPRGSRSESPSWHELCFFRHRVAPARGLSCKSTLCASHR